MDGGANITNRAATICHGAPFTSGGSNAAATAAVADDVARFIAPRHGEVMATRPRTEVTQWVKKNPLRQTALSADTWARTLGRTVSSSTVDG